MSERIQKVERWQTTDGELHSSFNAADYHQFDIDMAKTCDDMLQDGKSVADVLRHAGREIREDEEVLDRVTKDTELIIRHWQCRDTKGYTPRRINRGMTVFVYGDAGSWSGPFGGDITVRDLVRYAKETEQAEAARKGKVTK